MADGVTTLSAILWPVSLANSAAIDLIATCTDPTLRMRISAADTAAAERMSARLA